MFKYTPNMGTQFDEWCQRYGRTRPTQEIIDALNTRPVDRIAAVKEHTRNQNMQTTNVYRDFVTFASGRGNK